MVIPQYGWEKLFSGIAKQDWIRTVDEKAFLIGHGVGVRLAGRVDRGGRHDMAL